MSLRQWSMGPIKERLIKQLVWKGLNVPACNAVAVVYNEDIYKWILATRYLDTSHSLIDAFTSFLDALLVDRHHANITPKCPR